MSPVDGRARLNRLPLALFVGNGDEQVTLEFNNRAWTRAVGHAREKKTRTTYFSEEKPEQAPPTKSIEAPAPID
jgi:hypothetical protein